MCILTGLSFLGFSSVVHSENLTPPNSLIPPSYFGMHIHRAVSTTPWPSVPFKSWRLWDANVAWPWLEPVQGKWNFKELDKLVDLASKHNVEVLLPLGLSPRWASARPGEKSSYSPGNAAEPADINNWRTYVRTVALRYRGKIHYYEIWNEPNLPGFFTGSVDTMLILTKEARKILKEVDPSIIVVSPSATGQGGSEWFDKFLKQGGSQYVDVIGYHIYVSPAPPENVVRLVRTIKGSMTKYGVTKPLWNTEAGWFMANKKTNVKADASGFKSKILNSDEGIAYVARAFILNWAMGVERFYWYAWDNGEMGLTEADGKTVKAQAVAYAEIQKWLVGARMVKCTSDGTGTWVCQLARDGGYNSRIVWNPDKKTSFLLPEAWGVSEVRDLSGNKRAVKKGSASVEIGPIPQLLGSVTR